MVDLKAAIYHLLPSTYKLFLLTIILEAFMKTLLSVLLSLFLISSFVYSQDEAELKEKIQSINNKLAEMMLAGDEDAMWEYYAEDVISMPSYQPMMKGMEECKKASQEMIESGMEMIDFKSKVTDIIQSGDLVVDIGTYEISMKIPEMGDEPWKDHGKYMTIWEMQDDGSMKVKVETWNTDVNPWMEMQKMEEGKMEGHEGHMQKDKDVK
jgi:ketosteroid isomerase-like protein